jgi:hypothetical protein
MLAASQWRYRVWHSHLVPFRVETEEGKEEEEHIDVMIT